MSEQVCEAWFNDDFYQSVYDIPKAEALKHFVTFGDKHGWDPSPYFSTRHYKTLYSDWRENGEVTAVQDFMIRLTKDDVRSPHPLFDLNWYRAQYPDLPNNWPDVFLHFTLHGDGELRQPSANFNSNVYAATYMELGHTHAFRHFVTEGQARGFRTTFHVQSRQDSLKHMRAKAATATVVIGAHDAQKAGVPIMALDMARAARDLGFKPLMLLDRAGPILELMEDVCPVVVAAEGWNIEVLQHCLSQQTPVILNSAECAGIATKLARSGMQTVLLVHEMHAFLQERDLIDSLHNAQAAGVELIASFPKLAADLAPEFGRLRSIRPGIVTPDTSLSCFKKVRREIGNGAPVFIGAGQGSHRKGFDLFISVALALKTHHPEAHFIWLGTLDPWAQDLADQAKKDGLNLILPGFVTQFPAWYFCADVYLLTSRQDPGPATVFHAARMGVPFVAYNSNIGMAGQFDDSMGRFVPNGNVEQFVEAVQSYITAEGPQTRRARRAFVRNEGSFSRYFLNALEAASALNQDRRSQPL